MPQPYAATVNCSMISGDRLFTRPRCKVSKLRGGGGSWRDSVSLTVRPDVREIPPDSLPRDDFLAVTLWIKLNYQTIIDHWDGKLSLTELLERLQKLS
jgi:hypothetical protein